jgi:DeoR family deoxyribose operon repressor
MMRIGVTVNRFTLLIEAQRRMALGDKADQRVARLLAKAQSGGLLALRDAANMFGVSEMTVRRDIAGSGGRLAALGGHVIALADSEAPYALDKEQDTHLDAKIAACEHALRLIERDDTIFIDSGTTTCHIASRLPADLNLTVVCFSINVATILSRAQNIHWILIGGHYQAGTASFSGLQGSTILNEVRVNKAFLSAGGVHPKLGVSCANFSEVTTKRAALENAAESYLVIDRSKLGKVKAAHFADCADFTAILSERGSLRIAENDNGD